MRYLLNRNNGRILPWTKVWAARADHVECDKNGKPIGGFEEVVVGATQPPVDPATGEEALAITDDGFNPEFIRVEDGDTGALTAIDDADTATISAYAERHFGEKIDKRTKAENAQAQLRKLIAENGHPDEPEA